VGAGGGRERERDGRDREREQKEKEWKAIKTNDVEYRSDTHVGVVLGVRGR
jgi:hypothetical protein